MSVNASAYFVDALRPAARLLMVAAAVLAMIGPSRVFADDRPRQSGEPAADRRAADSLYSAGTLAFREKRYEDALDNFEQSYRLFSDPVLLYNIALTYELLLRPAEALKTYQNYLDAMPTAENRAAVEERMRIIRGTTARDPAPAPTAQPEPPPPPPATETAPEPTDASSTEAEPTDRVDSGELKVLPTWAFWTGVGVTGAVGGVVFWSVLDLLDAKDRYDDEQTQENKDDGLAAQRRTNILIGAAAGCAVLTAVGGIFFTDWHGTRNHSARTLRVSPAVASTGGMLTVSSSF